VRDALCLLAVTALAAALTGCGREASRTDAALSDTGQRVALSGGGGGAANACFRCHGLEGVGDGVSTPRLAGLDAGYLHKQLEDYALGVRYDPVMTPIARKLNGEARRRVAGHYAAMPAPVAATAPLSLSPVWTSACASCHGAAGEGIGSANPALSGQPAAYTVEQIKRWKTAKRRNDPRGVMATAVAGLSDADAKAIAIWLETRPVAPAPDSAAASVSASEAAAARSAASRAIRRPDQ
jgi:cytochrome c553